MMKQTVSEKKMIFEMYVILLFVKTMTVKKMNGMSETKAQ